MAPAPGPGNDPQLVATGPTPPLGGRWPLLGYLPRLVADPAGLAAEAMHNTDQVVPLRLGPVTVPLLHHPDHLQHILLTNQKNYVKGPMFARVGMMLGDGLVLAEGEAWRRQRKLMTFPFAPKRLQSTIPTIAEVVDRHLLSWRSAGGGAYELKREASAITMRVLLQTFFTTSMDDTRLDRFVRSFQTLSAHLNVRGPTFFLPDRFPLPGRRGALAARVELHQIIDQLIAERRRSGVDGADLLGLFLSARDEEGAPMSDELLRDEIKTAIFGGFETTATGIAFTLHTLASQPDIAELARAEVLRVMPEGLPNAEQLSQLDYLGRVFKDVLRLYPPFSFHPRMALEDDVICGHPIRAGTTLFYSNYAAGRNPRYWAHPETLDPDHFLPEAVAQRHRFAYVPFAAGPRICLGMALAMIEAQVVLGLVLRDFELRALAPLVMKAKFGPTQARGGVQVELRPRRKG